MDNKQGCKYVNKQRAKQDGTKQAKHVITQRERVNMLKGTYKG